ELQKKEVKFSVDIGLGGGSATSWGCDLTYDYVKINAKYRT
ncbi:MAG: bifunctional ornithine acetyltransferase/N-acetylglutamate synthase, partial [Candidatus Saganbacteria bacterium]|nr:bifunctional ornithine acetyltransferase/N-acetylglutamate synthase [Candidatus Saganbacteria bacterium]